MQIHANKNSVKYGPDFKYVEKLFDRRHDERLSIY